MNNKEMMEIRLNRFNENANELIDDVMRGIDRMIEEVISYRENDSYIHNDFDRSRYIMHEVEQFVTNYANKFSNAKEYYGMAKGVKMVLESIDNE